MSRTIHVAAAQYPIESLTSATAWADKLARWVDEAASAGAQLLVFPEYASMEAASFLLSSPSQDVAAHLDAVVDHAERAAPVGRVVVRQGGVALHARRELDPRLVLGEPRPQRRTVRRLLAAPLLQRQRPPPRSQDLDEVVGVAIGARLEQRGGADEVRDVMGQGHACTMTRPSEDA